MSITLRFEGKEITLKTHSVNQELMFKAQDLIEQSPRPDYRLDHYIVSLRNDGLIGLPEFRGHPITTGSNEARGTYFYKRGILRLAGKINPFFEAQVYTAFNLLRIYYVSNS